MCKNKAGAEGKVPSAEAVRTRQWGMVVDEDVDGVVVDGVDVEEVVVEEEDVVVGTMVRWVVDEIDRR